MRNSVIVTINISAEDFLAHYQGTASQVVATTASGQHIKFPSNILQPFVTHHGVRGTFKIEFDAQNRFSAINRLK